MSMAVSSGERRDNITRKALTLFQIFCDDGLTRADIYHYVYALLHHTAYRTRYAENLKRELPRIPFIGCSGGLATAAISKPAKKSVGGGTKAAESPRTLLLTLITSQNVNPRLTWQLQST